MFDCRHHPQHHRDLAGIASAWELLDQPGCHSRQIILFPTSLVLQYVAGGAPATLSGAGTGVSCREALAFRLRGKNGQYPGLARTPPWRKGGRRKSETCSNRRNGCDNGRAIAPSQNPTHYIGNKGRQSYCIPSCNSHIYASNRTHRKTCHSRIGYFLPSWGSSTCLVPSRV
jgi:hypothetical protein